MIKLYCTLLYPYIIYGIELWGYTLKYTDPLSLKYTDPLSLKYTDPLSKIQRRVMRMINFAHLRERTTHLFQKIRFKTSIS